MNNDLPSRTLQDAVNAFSSIPGIGKKSALRMSLHLLRMQTEEIASFTNAIASLKNIHYCPICKNISDDDVCSICTDSDRDRQTVCVVESIKEVMLIENTSQYKGLYHVLGGLISPMAGVGPSDLEIDSLVERVKSGEIKEVILALSPNIEGDTTSFYIYRKLSSLGVLLTTIAQGVAVGDDLEFADEITLGRSITNRINYQAQ